MKILELWEEISHDLADREREILERHFGLHGSEEKLASIGREFGLSRERIRQLKERSLQKILRNLEISGRLKKLRLFLQERVNSLNFRAEQKLETILQSEKKSVFEIRVVKLLIRIQPEILYHPESQIYRAYLSLAKESFLCLKHTLTKIKKSLSVKKLYPEETILQIAEKEIKNHFRKKPNLEEILELLFLLKALAKNPFGHFGHIENEFIYPKTLKEKLMLVFEYQKKPLHYLTVHQILQNLAQNKDEFLSESWQKIYTPESVRNELIRHPEFTFVGKGTYALRKWGLEAGSAKELLVKFLRREKKVKIEVLWQKISQLRKIKKSSFYIYLKSLPEVSIEGDYVRYQK